MIRIQIYLPNDSFDLPNDSFEASPFKACTTTRGSVFCTRGVEQPPVPHYSKKFVALMRCSPIGGEEPGRNLEFLNDGAYQWVKGFVLRAVDLLFTVQLSSD